MDSPHTQDGNLVLWCAVQQGGRFQPEELASQACGHWHGHGACHLCAAEQDVQLRY